MARWNEEAAFSKRSQATLLQVKRSRSCNGEDDMNKAITMTVGCDLGDKYSVICVLDRGGRVVEETKVRTTVPGIRSFFAPRDPMRVVIEVGTHSAWVAELLGELGHETLVANPRRVQLISKGNRKSDRVDAELLARLGRADPKLLAPIQHRKRTARRDLLVIRSRALLVETRSSLVIHVRGTVKPFARRIPTASVEVFPKRAREALAESDLLPIMEPVLAVIDSLNEKIRALDSQIAELGKLYDTLVLEQIVGVGTMTALTFVLTIEDKTRFEKSRDVGPYLGLVPRRAQSGGRDPALGITKAGDQYLRKILINCAHYVYHRGPDTDLQRWARKLADRDRTHAKRKALVALARRLAVLLHRLWVTGEVYQPLGYASARTAATAA